MIALTVLIVAVAVIAVVVVAAAGARCERGHWLANRAPGPLARAARRILGLHVCKPSGVPGQPRQTADAGERR